MAHDSKIVIIWPFKKNSADPWPRASELELRPKQACPRSREVTNKPFSFCSAGENLGLGPQTQTPMSLPARQTHRTRKRAPTGCSACRPEASYPGGAGWGCQPDPAWTALSCPRPLRSADTHFGLFALDKKDIPGERPEGEQTCGVAERGSQASGRAPWRGAQGSAEMASPQSLVFWEGGACFVNWFGVGNGFSFSLISLISLGGGVGITGCSVPRGQSGGGRSATLSLV